MVGLWLSSGCLSDPSMNLPNYKWDSAREARLAPLEGEPGSRGSRLDPSEAWPCRRAPGGM